MAFIENGYVSLNKIGEELCGDSVNIINRDDSVTAVLADGLGSGVKASILSTLTSKIIGTMISNGLKLSDCVETIAHTLPVCKDRQIAYSTFSIAKIMDSGETYLTQYDNPTAIVVHNGKCIDYKKEKQIVSGKTIYESHLKLSMNDLIILLSDGVVHAGIGFIYNLGWRHKNVCEYIESRYNPDFTAKNTAAMIIGACKQLYADMPGDDTTVAVLKIRKKNVVSVMAGPPANKDDDRKIISQFINSDGMKVICGGTTSQIVAKYLKTEVKPNLNYISVDIPPTATIKGIDLVTEGVLTLNKAIEIINDYSKSNEISSNYFDSQDGATQLSKILIEDSTEIKFFVGRAINPAHQNPDFPLDLSIKRRLIDDLSQSLIKLGKNVVTVYN